MHNNLEQNRKLEELILIAESWQKTELGKIVELPKIFALIKENNLRQKNISEFFFGLDLQNAIIPRLNPALEVQCVKDFAELGDLFLHVLNSKINAIDVERLFEGLSRLGPCRPENYTRNIESIYKCLFVDSLDSFGNPIIGLVTGIKKDFIELACIWLKPVGAKETIYKQLNDIALDGPIFAKNSFQNINPHSFFSKRSNELFKRLNKLNFLALPLLSAPTHINGFIDPRILVKRWLKWSRTGLEINRADFIQSLLRIAPEFRSEALASLPEEGNEYLQAMRYALGGTSNIVFQSPELFVAAFRCREPFGTNDFFQKRFPFLGPDSALAASYDENLQNYYLRKAAVLVSYSSSAIRDLPLEPIPELVARDEIFFYPTELIHYSQAMTIPENIINYYWPQNRVSLFANNVRRVAAHLESQGDYWLSDLDWIIDPDLALYGPASWLLALLLTAKNTKLQEFSQKILIEAISQERISALEFGQILAKLFASKKMNANRWVKAFNEVANISSLHKYFVLIVLDNMICYSAKELKLMVPSIFVELFYELASQNNYAILTNNLGQCFEALSLKGKIARLLKEVLNVKSSLSEQMGQEILFDILKNRVERVQRWQSWYKFNSEKND